MPLSRAVRDSADWIVTGTKHFISHADASDFVILFAATGEQDPDAEAPRRAEITAFLVDADRAGFRRGKTEPKLGIRASATCEIEFADYVVQPSERLGDEGHGFKIAMGVLDAGRIGIASQSGAYGTHLYTLARNRGIGVSLCIMTGNEADVTVGPVLAAQAGPRIASKKQGRTVRSSQKRPGGVNVGLSRKRA